jgi:phytanoyl-CoA hydroxylase
MTSVELVGDHINEYTKYGFTRYTNLFDVEFIERINTIIDSLSTLKESDTVFYEDGLKIKQIQYLYNYDPLFNVILEKLQPIAKELSGEQDLTILNMQLFEKHPLISKPTRSHQDNAYFKQYPATPLTFWISLDTITELNGALYYAPYTHLTPTRKHQRYHKHTTFRVRSGVPGLSLCLHEHPEETDVIMNTNPGDVLVHNSNTIHRADKNNSTNLRRRAIGVVFIPKSCGQDERLMKYYNDQIKEDIELQKIKDPALYRKLVSTFDKLH